MPPNSTLTIGQRLYLIRLACGDGVRRPESAADFGRRVKKATGLKYDQATISRLETGGRNWLLEDVEAFAAVDPLQRGRAWLAGFDGEPVQEVPAARPIAPPLPASALRAVTLAEPSAGKKKDRPGNR